MFMFNSRIVFSHFETEPITNTHKHVEKIRSNHVEKIRSNRVVFVGIVETKKNMFSVGF